MSAGYSGTPLWRKLGFKPGMRAALQNAPEGFAIAELPPGVEWVDGGSVDLVMQFATERAVLKAALPALKQAIAPAGMAWIAWPKKAGTLPTDITEDVVREEALPLGLVDTKVCAIDATWSGLRLVIRKELR